MQGILTAETYSALRNRDKCRHRSRSGAQGLPHTSFIQTTRLHGKIVRRTASWYNPPNDP